MATLCGVVERVNKLVYVRPLKSRSASASMRGIVKGNCQEKAFKGQQEGEVWLQEAGMSAGQAEYALMGYESNRLF